MKSYAKLKFARSFVVYKFFEFYYVKTVLVKVFSHALDFLQHGVSAFSKLNVFLANICF